MIRKRVADFCRRSLLVIGRFYAPLTPVFVLLVRGMAQGFVPESGATGRSNRFSPTSAPVESWKVQVPVR